LVLAPLHNRHNPPIAQNRLAIANFPIPLAANFFAVRGRLCNASMTCLVIRIREIADPELRAKIVAALADRRGCAAAAIPDWFELDDADYVDLLNDLDPKNAGGDENDGPERPRDPRM